MLPSLGRPSGLSSEGSGLGLRWGGGTVQQTRSLTTPSPPLGWICGFKLNQAAVYLCVSEKIFSTFD